MGTYDLLWIKAACKKRTNLMHPELDDLIQIERAKKVCAKCPVRNTCLEYALETRQPIGIWGGKTEHERRNIKTSRFIRTMREAQVSHLPNNNTHEPLHLANVSLSFQECISDLQIHNQQVSLNSSAELLQFDFSWLHVE